MTKKFAVALLVAVMTLCGTMSPALAAEAGNGQVTHEELAQMLVDLLSLSRFLPAAPSPQERFEALLKNQIAPPDAWEQGKPVSKGDLAVVIVKCLKAMGETIEGFDLNDPKACIQYLKQQNIPIDTIGEGLQAVGPISHPVAANVFDPTTDPLDSRQKFSSTDEEESGADARRDTTGVVLPTPEEVAAVIVQVPRRRHKKEEPTPYRPPQQTGL